MSACRFKGLAARIDFIIPSFNHTFLQGFLKKGVQTTLKGFFVALSRNLSTICPQQKMGFNGFQFFLKSLPRPFFFLERFCVNSLKQNNFNVSFGVSFKVFEFYTIDFSAKKKTLIHPFKHSCFFYKRKFFQCSFFKNMFMFFQGVQKTLKGHFFQDLQRFCKEAFQGHSFQGYALVTTLVDQKKKPFTVSFKVFSIFHSDFRVFRQTHMSMFLSSF